MEKQNQPSTYKAAGVDIDLGDEFIRRIKPFAASTHIPGVVHEIGSFAGLFDGGMSNRRDPLLVACTDGVGTKLKLAIEFGKHDTIGIDLVAMSINDLLVCGAEPLFFLDYLATDHLNLEIHTDVVKGIAEGCRESGCALLGGETAEMPGLYHPGDYDLAGFAVGVVDRSRILSPEGVQPGDLLLGLPSSGIHSNGYSLVRSILSDRERYPGDMLIPGESRPLREVLLAPTRIYSREMKIILASGSVRSLAHITGGGIPGNLPRALPESLGAEIDLSAWTPPPIYPFLADAGNVSVEEMRRTFNMGLGMIAVCEPSRIKSLQASLTGQGLDSFIIGKISSQPGIRFGGRPVYTIATPVKQTVTPAGSCVLDLRERKPRIAVFGSGSGSNMESLCKAIDQGLLPAVIGCVISNNSRAFILERARLRNIPAHHVSTRTHPDPDGFNAHLLELMTTNGINLICLAGYMKKMPIPLIRHFEDRILNIHPALLPAFGGKGMYGLNVHKSVISSGACVSGASIHIVNEEYDRGRIIAQTTVPVLSDDTPEILASRVLCQEHELYWRAVKNHLLILQDQSED